MGEIRDRLVTGTKHSLLANLVLTAAAAVQFIAVARLLGKEDYGVFRILVNMTQVGGLLAVAGLQGAMVKFVAEFADSREDLQKVVSNCLALNVISAVIICGLFVALSGIIAVKGYQEPRLTMLIIISSATMFVVVVFGQFRSIIHGFQQIPLYAKLVMLQGLAMLAGVVSLTWLFGLTGTALGILAGSLIQAAASVPLGLRALKRHGIKFSLSLDKVTAKKMLNFGVPSLLSGLIFIPAIWFGSSVLIWNHGFGELGLFGVANAIYMTALLIPRAIGVASFPLISDIDSRDSANAAKVSVRIIRMVSLIMLPPTVMLVSLSYWFVPLVFGEQYSQAVFPLQLMAVVAYLSSVGALANNYLYSTGRMWQAFGFSLIWFMLFIPLAYLLGGKLGASGLAWTYAGASLVYLSAQVAYLWIGLKLSLRICVAPSIITAIMVFLSLLFRNVFNTGFSGATMALVFCFVSVLLSYAVATNQERDIVLSQIKKVLSWTNVLLTEE